MNNFIEDDQEPELSLSSLSVQIFTVPSLANYLLEHENAFEIMMSTFYEKMKNYTDEVNGDLLELQLSLWLDDDKKEFRRSQSILQDMSYLLSVVPDKFSDKMKTNFLKGVDVLINCLCLLQGMDRQTRQIGHHVEYDTTEWERAYKMTSSFIGITESVAKWCRNDKSVLIGAIK